MYAVMTTGGRQYRVSPGDTIDVEKLMGAVGETVTVTNVQLVGQGAEVIVGAPAVAGVRVEAQIIAQKRGKKIIIFKHRRRKGYRRKQGHRQSLTSLRVMGIYTLEQSIEQQSIEHDEPPPLSEEGIAEERQYGT